MRRLGSRLIPFEIAPCLASQDRASRADRLRMIDDPALMPSAIPARFTAHGALI
jgi:hypothetical protein